MISSGNMSSLHTPIVPAFGAQLALNDDVYADHATIWKSQRSVRTVVSFLARNIAQLGLHWFDRVSDTDRVRVTDHPLVKLMARPNPVLKLTPYRLFNNLMHELGIYDNAFWIKLRDGNGLVNALVPIPAPRMRPKGGTWLAPEKWQLWTDGVWKDVGVENIVHFHGYDPDDPRVGNSPLNALKDLLLEEYEAIRSRRQMWRNGARLSGVIERPKDAPDWGKTARNRFKRDWRSAYSGGGAEAGGTPLLEDGMTYKAIGLDPKAAQYVESRKLTREEAAAGYHVSPVFVGVLDHATYSNITEQHKNLYQDTLGPWLQQIQQDIQEQLVPDFPDAADMYGEFNFGEKLRGSFEEQAAAASTATGGPWMTRNEQRARMNLPRIDGGDELIVPLNVVEGGLASPRDTAPDTTG
ncbi:phage portal protein [Streptomyces sp. ID05-26A]|nr:phage portal protein [Streptomyces sp. ID05-26A]